MSESTATKGRIKVHTENIFPIIKKFLYSDQEIFLRELISNAVDATNKAEKLAKSGELKGELGDLYVEVSVDKVARTIKISDKGIGMTLDEVDKYINQIAFSSAEEFLEKFKNVDGGLQVIGHFGLGFYSAFMVADYVEIISKSYKDEPAAHWTCDGSPEFELKTHDKKERGTEIILHVSDSSLEYLEEFKISSLLDKYCKFLPVSIVFGTEKYNEKEGEAEVEKERKKVINNVAPAWLKQPSELKDEDYLSFYEVLYPMQEKPLFWIHLNVDYPFKLTGILYFPKLRQQAELHKNKIQLYSNQVFVTDNVESVVPEYLMLMHGVIDSPDIPLNVSRSYLQSDSQVKKITSHISKKVADKLGELFAQNRNAFEEKWESIGLFVKYGMISDEKFYEKAGSYCLYKDEENTYFTLEELKEKTKDNQTDKNQKLILLYSSDLSLQNSYVEAVKKKNYKVLEMNEVLDQAFIQHIESKSSDLRFSRVDADTPDKIIEKDENIESILSKEEEEKLKQIFIDNIKDRPFDIELKAMGADESPVMVTQNEFMRRMKDMSKYGGAYSFMGTMPERYNLIVNTNHPLSSKLLRARKKEELVSQLFDLALLSQGLLQGKSLTDFINRSVNVLTE